MQANNLLKPSKSETDLLKLKDISLNQKKRVRQESMHEIKADFLSDYQDFLPRSMRNQEFKFQLQLEKTEKKLKKLKVADGSDSLRKS